MKSILYTNNNQFLAGVTMKDETAPEKNNMALHTCEDPAVIADNRAHLAASLNLNVKDFVCAQQTHSANFYRVEAADKGRGAIELASAIQETDALYTYEPGIALSSFAADCVPLLFFNEKTGVVGAVHSGWQGTVKEISLKLFTHLIETEHCPPEDFRVQIGPALSQEKFEVDEDVYVKFKALGYADSFIDFNESTGKYHIDNQSVVKKQCELAGIPPEAIAVDRTCTFQDPAGFSYRENRKAGRHMAFIVKK